MSRLRFTALLLCCTAIISTPVMADASLDELKAKLEQAQRENIILKTEKLERENITMKLEKIEAENAALRNETKVDKTPTASIPSQKAAAAPINPSPEAKTTLARRETIEANASTPRERVAVHKEINRELDNIPKDDTRREMTAAYKASREDIPTVVKQWQGIYVGINVGYGGNGLDASSSSYQPVSGFSAAATTTSSFGVGGPLAGGQVGYNHQFSNKVILGVETDLDYADINSFAGTRKSSTAAALIFTGSTNTINSNNYDRLGLNWLGTTRLRLGYALGNFLPYVSGGIAYGELTSALLSTNSFAFTYSSGGASSGSVTSGNSSTTQVGWTLGGGMEYRLADSWSLKGDYLYTSLGGITRNDTTIGTGIVAFGKTSTSAYAIHQARVGLNYHTGWLGGGAPTVTAKY